MRTVDGGCGEGYDILRWAALKCLRRSKGLLYAFSQAVFEVGDEGTLSTDGERFRFDKEIMKNDFLSDSDLVCLKLLHMMAHCMLGHPFEERRRAAGAWEKAEDAVAAPDKVLPAAAETQAADVPADEISRISAASLHDLALDLEAWELACAIWGSRPSFLGEAEKSLDRGEYTELLYVDDHSGWLSADPRLEQRWKGEGGKLIERAGGKGRRKAGVSNRSLEYHFEPGRGGRGEYASVLKSFAVYREDARPDLDSFQYSWYNYGMELYGRMPIIEPLEYTEDKRVSDLVIAIDTSGSCVRDLVQIFLEETKGIMKQENLFFRRFCLHLIQCDNRIQSDDCITSMEDMDDYIDSLTVRGGGGTDFRPVFGRVEELREMGALRGLKGLIYFTDGTGLYPAARPDYEVVFVMPGGRYDDIDRPPWVRRVLFDID